ncbi:MAG: hypothetical protein Q4G69_06135 [Planctomycetia bacterium]|nr:hypothetical protein [Planctomycetia bacterium]
METSLFETFAPLILMIVFGVLIFGFFFAALGLKRLFGKKVKRQCACAMSREIIKKFEERDKNAREAARYSPSTVDPKDLPIIK